MRAQQGAPTPCGGQGEVAVGGWIGEGVGWGGGEG